MPHLAICKTKTINPKHFQTYFQKQYITIDELLRYSSLGHHRKVTGEIDESIFRVRFE